MFTISESIDEGTISVFLVSMTTREFFNNKVLIDIMDTQDVRFIKKKTNVTSIEAHPTEDAVIVTYQIDATLMADTGDAILTESRECQKQFMVKNLDKVKDIDNLCLELIQQSEKLMSYSQVDEVKQILLYLISRKNVANDSATKMKNLRPKTAQLIRASKQIDEEEKTDRTCFLNRSFWTEFPSLENEIAAINNLDEYVEHLYEDIPEKIKGAGLILKLSQSSDNLKEMASNETLLCALTRVLREDGRKSIELSTLIIAIFALFSEYKNFHEMITQYKIGSQTIDLVHYEISKEAEWQETLTSRQSSASTNSSNPPSASGSRSLASPAPAKEKSNKRYHQLVSKQNQMLKVSFNLLLNLSEDQKLEMKMVNKGILDQLIKSLQREADVDLLIIVLKFLLKLSIYIENKNVLAEKAVPEKLFVLFVFTSKTAEINQEFITAILSLVYNLSFDVKIVKNMIQVGMISKLFLFWCRNRIVIKRSLEQLILRILYQASRESTFRRHFDFSPSTGVESIELFMAKVMRNLEISSTNRPTTSRNLKSLCGTELLALAINLSVDYKIATRMANDGRLTSLLKHVYGNRRPTDLIELTTIYTIKVIRNLSNHSHDYKKQFVPFVEKIVEIVCEMKPTNSKPSYQPRSRKKAASDNSIDDIHQSFITESIAILGNLNEANLNIEWFKILEKFEVFEWLVTKLTSKGDWEDDLVLEVIILLGTVCLEEKCAAHFVSINGMDLVTELLDKLQEDDEIVLQTLYLIYVIAENQSLKQEMASNSKLSSLLIDLMNDSNGEVKKLASATLDMFSVSHQVWANKVRMEGFRTHNQQWLQMIQSSSNSEDLLDPFGESVLEQESDQEIELNDLVMRAELLNSSLDSTQDSRSTSPPLRTPDPVHSEVVRPKTAQRPTTGYGRR